jgi:adenosylcobinamide kinase / adenosylcobinamide-phosphate guanylyltransferase
MRAGAPGGPGGMTGPGSASPVPASPVPAGPVAAGPVPASPVPAGPLVYPLGLRARSRLTVVVGGGAAAERRVAALLTAQADVLVVTPMPSPSLASAASDGRITIRQHGYAASDLDGAWLVLACSGDPGADAAVVADAERRRIWCASDDDAAASLAWVPDDAGPGNRVLVLGGARSGKSATAEQLLAEHAQVDYIATGPGPGPGDAEWRARVLVHQQRRPAGWRTIETLDVEREIARSCVAAAESAAGSAGADADVPAAVPVLVDCLSTWLAGVMDECGIWTGQPGADRALANRADALVAAWRAAGRQVVAVSSEVGSGVVPGTVSGRRFRDELGSLNARIAAECDQVWLCTAGIARRLR